MEQTIRFRTTDRWCAARLCQLRRRHAAGENRQLAQSPGIRLAKPAVAALVLAAVRQSHACTDMTCAARACPIVSSPASISNARSADLEQIVDAAGLERFAIARHCLRVSPVAVEYAVRHPERVTHMVHARRLSRAAGPTAVPEALRCRPRAMTEIVRVGWGVGHPGLSPHVRRAADAARPVTTRWHGWSELQKSHGDARRSRRASWRRSGEHRCRAATVRRCVSPRWCCTPRRDAMVPFDAGQRCWPPGFPAPRFVELDSPNHVLLEDEPAWERFRAGRR